MPKRKPQFTARNLDREVELPIFVPGKFRKLASTNELDRLPVKGDCILDLDKDSQPLFGPDGICDNLDLIGHDSQQFCTMESEKPKLFTTPLVIGTFRDPIFLPTIDLD